MSLYEQSPLRERPAATANVFACLNGCYEAAPLLHRLRAPRPRPAIGDGRHSNCCSAARFESPAKGIFNASRELRGTLPDYFVLFSERRLQRPPHPNF